jgi:diacylglycerol kinase (ATP)
MTSKDHSQMARLGFAWAGLVEAWKRERSFRTEVIVIAIVLTFLFYRGTPLPYCLMAILAAAIALAAELFNTSVEAICDLMHPDPHPLVKVAKDCASAAVLVANVAAITLVVTVLWVTR